MYFKKLLSLLLLISTVSFAQNTLNGSIKENGKIPIIGATVKLSSTLETKSVLSDKNGNFEFTNLSDKNYKLSISSIGYEAFSQEVKANQTLEISLKPSETLLQDVEVLGRARKDYNSDYSFSATKIAIKNKELPQALSTVTKELIADRGAFQLADAVKIASGVSPSSFYNQFNIRGISQNEEGQIINGMRTRQFYFLQPLTTNVERVEVLKGPASVTFSSVDPGGSINMVTKKPLAETRREVSLSAGSFSTVRGALDFTGPLNESKTLLYRINGAYQEAQSYRDLVKNNSVLISPSITYLPSDKTAINTELIYSNMVGNLDRGQPIFGAVAGKTNLNSTPISLNLGAANDFFKSKELILTANLSHKFSEKISFNASYMKQTWSEDLQEHRTTNAFARDITGAEVTSLVGMQMVQRKQLWNTDNLNAYFNFNFKAGKTSHKLLVGYDLQSWNKLKGGGQNAARGFLLKDGSVAGSFAIANAANYQTVTIGGKTLPRPNTNYFDLSNPVYTVRNINDYTLNSRIAVPSALTTTDAIYIQEQLKIGKFSALLSLRNEWFEDITNYNAPNEASFKNTALIPRIGLTYEVTKNINVYGTYLEGYQPQSNTVTLLPSTGAYFWTPTSAATFKPLISDLKELGVKTELFEKRFTLNAAVYEINQKNILMSANDPTKPDLLVQRGADRSRGFETDLAGFILPNWQINASYSFIDAKIIADANEALVGQRKENVAKHSGNVWTRYNFGANSKLKDLGIGAGMNAQGSRIPWFSRAFEVPAFTTFDAAIYYTPSKSNVQVALNMNNIFDKTYWIGAQNYTRLFPGAPRNFMLTATYKF
ncbi:TonB-dependent receptor [Lacihabitans soyangensis]|uniref:TonB-dependent receptor n=1 Tax=Lacihabitans soyangensis TaxID=869394 RepID=A0AAE3H3C1_9BACT|nr:TonB-dependent receptor [Lacihabitans soyangensis]MCP9763244.1 TonB-dependent receptor [Lacihabitans soyangensis]